MAFFAIPAAGLALTASTADDTISFAYSTTAVVSANTILGIDGDDILNLGPQGLTAIASAHVQFSGNGGVSGSTTGVSGTVSLVGSAGNIYASSFSTGVTGLSGVINVVASGTVTGVVTSQRAVRSISNSKLYGNVGNDSIAFGNQLVTLQESTIGGGAGNDVIGSFTYVNNVWTGNAALGTGNGLLGTGLTIDQAFIEAGGGNDIVSLVLTGGTFTASTIQGGQGDDSITFVNTASGVTNQSQILAGGGDDIISGSISGASSFTVAGGGGNDSITLTASIAGGVARGLMIAGDTFGARTIYDGNDVISGSFGVWSASTIDGGAGNDSIYISGLDDGGNNYVAGAAGNDLFQFDTTASAGTIAGGAGEDVIQILSGIQSQLVYGGGDNDHINISGGITNQTGIASAATVYGGAGADRIGSGASLTGMTGTVTWGYSATDQSTLSAMDTIAVGGGAQSGGHVFYYDPAGLALGSFSAVVSGTTVATGTNGVVVFTGTYDTDVTARVSLINSQLTTVGSTVAFRDGAGVSYLFVQGGTTDMVVRVGTAASNGIAGITLQGGKTVTLDLD